MPVFKDKIINRSLDLTKNATMIPLGKNYGGRIRQIKSYNKFRHINITFYFIIISISETTGRIVVISRLLQYIVCHP